MKGKAVKNIGYYNWQYGDAYWKTEGFALKKEVIISISHLYLQLSDKLHMIETNWFHLYVHYCGGGGDE